MSDLYSQLTDMFCTRAEERKKIAALIAEHDAAQRAKIEHLTAELALAQHYLACWAHEIGGVICPECDQLAQAAAAAGGKRE